jgi:putative transcriptional regulator
MDKKSFDELMRGVGEMKAHRAGKKTGARVHVPTQVDVAAIRKKLGMTQRDFCTTFAIAERTLKSWESGERTPEGPARVLLTMISRAPKTVLRLTH